MDGGGICKTASPRKEKKMLVVLEEESGSVIRLTTCLETTYFGPLSEALQNQRKEGTLCDVVLVAEGKKFPAHRCLLAAASPYFRSMFEEFHFQESLTKEVKLCSIEKDDLEVLLNFIYTGKLELTNENIYTLLAAADHLILTLAKRECTKFLKIVLKSQFAKQEVLHIYSTARLFNLQDVLQSSYDVISAHFHDAIRSPVLLHLTFPEIEMIISDENIKEKNEKLFWDAAMSWIKKDFRTRKENFNTLMQKVKFPLMEPEELMGEIQNDELMKNLICQKLIEEAKTYLLLTKRRSLLQNARTKPRDGHCQRIYCISGGGEQFLCYVIDHDKWYHLQAPVDMALDEQQFEMKLLSMKKKLYLEIHRKSEQEVGHHVIEKLLLFNHESNSWKPCALPSIIDSVSLICFLQNGKDTLCACSRKAIESYDPEQNSWKCLLADNVASYIVTSQFLVTDEDKIYFYNLESGTAKVVYWPSLKNIKINAHQILSPTLFVVDILSVTKLKNHDVLIPLRSVTGISRKIFNVKTNLWRDANLTYHPETGSPSHYRVGKQHPPCLDPQEQWEILCDKKANCLYILGTNSGMCDVPSSNSGSDYLVNVEHTGETKKDGVLPFYKFNQNSNTWHRLACLPEAWTSSDVMLTLENEDTSMATCTM